MTDEGAPIVGGTAEDFMERYARGKHVTTASLKRMGRYPVYVSGCSDYDHPHWEMAADYWDDFDKRRVIEPPTN